ncbi:hypothetical protein [Savagea serpentis]|nr:hypothetical protein [Savagea serpentis]
MESLDDKKRIVYLKNGKRV